MKNKLLYLLVFAAVFAFAVAPALAVPQYTGTNWNGLYAGRTQIEVGTINTYVEESNLHIVILTYDPWVLVETHVAVGTNPVNDFPMTKTGNPKVGNFPYAHTGLNGVNRDEYVIALSEVKGWSAGVPICIAAHAIVTSPLGQETAWGNCGTPKGTFAGLGLGNANGRGNWALYYWYPSH